MDELQIIIILAIVLALKAGAPILALLFVFFLLPGAVKKGVMRAQHGARQLSGQAYNKTSWGRQRAVRKQMKEGFQGRDAAMKVNRKLASTSRLGRIRAGYRRAQIGGWGLTAAARTRRGDVSKYSNQQNIKTIMDEIGQENPDMLNAFLAGRGNGDAAITAMNNIRQRRGQQPYAANSAEAQAIRDRVSYYNNRGYGTAAGGVAMMRQAAATAALSDEAIAGAAHFAGVDHQPSGARETAAAQDFANEAYNAARAARGAGQFSVSGLWDTANGTLLNGGTQSRQAVERLNPGNFASLDQSDIGAVMTHYGNLSQNPNIGTATTAVNTVTPEGNPRTVTLDAFDSSTAADAPDAQHLNELARMVAMVRGGKIHMESRKAVNLEQQLQRLGADPATRAAHAAIENQVQQRIQQNYFD